MNIRNFLHKGLLRLYVEDSPRGVPPDAVAKLRTMLTFLQDMRSPEEAGAYVRKLRSLLRLQLLKLKSLHL